MSGSPDIRLTTYRVSSVDTPKRRYPSSALSGLTAGRAVSHGIRAFSADTILVAGDKRYISIYIKSGFITPAPYLNRLPITGYGLQQVAGGRSLLIYAMKIVSRSQFWSLAGLLLVDTAFFTTTDPQEVPSFVLIIGFLLLTATIYAAVKAALAVARWYGVLPSAAHRRRLARVITGLIAGLVALQSIGQLGLRDVLVLLPLTLLAYLYITYGRTDKRSTSSAVTY